MRLIAPQRPLLWIVLGALVLRLAAAVWLQHVLDVQQRHFLITGDAEGYWELGREIAQGEPYQLYDPPRRVERMPGYPAFVAASIRLSEAWGISPERQYFVARLLLAVVGTLNCWLVARLGRELFDEPTGNLAAAIAAIAPPLIGFSVILLSETLFATGLLLSLWSMASPDAAARPPAAVCHAYSRGPRSPGCRLRWPFTCGPVGCWLPLVVRFCSRCGWRKSIR